MGREEANCANKMRRLIDDNRIKLQLGDLFNKLSNRVGRKTKYLQAIFTG